MPVVNVDAFNTPEGIPSETGHEPQLPKLRMQELGNEKAGAGSKVKTSKQKLTNIH